MRVLFYYSSPAWSGSARAFATLARTLAARGSQVTFVCPADSAVEQRLAGDGYEVFPFEPGGGTLRQAWRLRRVLRDRFVEAVAVHTEEEHLVASIATRMAERGAVIRRTAAGARLEVGGPTQMATRLAATGFVFGTQGERDAATPPRNAMEPVVVDLGVDAAGYDRVPPAPPNALGGEPGERLLACVYEPRARGRAATVLRTVALLAPRHPRLRLAIVGRGSDHEDLRMHAAALGITDMVSLLGEREDAISVLRSASLGWVAAEHDDAAFGVLDLMACRVPALVERGSVGQRYVADSITGVLLPAADAAASAAAVSSLLAHADERRTMGAAGHAHVLRGHTEAGMADRFVAAVEQARDRTRWRSR